MYRFFKLQGGYREGIASGKESRLQDGFNDGFTDAAKTIFLLAKERGKIRFVFSS